MEVANNATHVAPKAVMIRKEFGSVCILCLKTKTHTSVKCDLEQHFESRLVCMKYIASISKYLNVKCELAKTFQDGLSFIIAADRTSGNSAGISNSKHNSSRSKNNALLNINDTLPIPSSSESIIEQWEKRFENLADGDTSKFVLCELCVPIAESFCKNFQEYEVLRLQLERRIYEATRILEKSSDSLQKVVVSANRYVGPSSQRNKHISKSSAETLNSNQVSTTREVLTEFRRLLKHHGERLLKSSKPRVHLKRSVQADEQVMKKLAKSSDPPLNSAPEVPLSTPSAPPLSTHTSSPSAVTFTPTLSVNQPLVTRPQENVAISSIPAIVNVTSLNPIKPVTAVSQSDLNQVKLGTTLNSLPEGLTQAIRALLQANPSYIGQKPIISIVKAVANEARPVTLPDPSASPIQPNSIYTGHNPVNVSRPPQPTTTTTLGGRNAQPGTGLVLPPINILACGINNCGMTFTNTEQGVWCMHSHFLNSHANLPCRKCNYTPKDPFDLINHELKQHERKDPSRKYGFHCTKCHRWSSCLTEHQEHFFLAHLGTKVELIKCPKCKKSFQHIEHQKLQQHVEKAHTEDMTNKETCILCNSHFKSRKYLWQHLIHDHAINVQDGPIRCPQYEKCTSAFHSTQFLELHEEFFHRMFNKRFPCPIDGCNSSFGLWRSCKTHIETKHPDFTYLKCHLCQQKFAYERTLKCHMQIHEEESTKQGRQKVNNQAPALEISNGLATEPETQPVIVSVTGSVPSSHSNASQGVVDYTRTEQFDVKPVGQRQIIPSDIFFDEGSGSDDDEEMIDFNQVDLFNLADNEIPNIEDPFGWIATDDF